MLVCLLTPPPANAGWQEDADALLKVSSRAEQDRLVAAIVAARPDWRDVSARIRAQGYPDLERGEALTRSVTVDGVKRPYVLYVPGAYDPKRPAPMLVWLHGAVTREELLKDPGPWAEQSAATRLAESQGWLCLYPLGKAGVTWWDAAGMANIRAAVRDVKRLCNVEDDRVVLGGFSDGASGALLHAMVMPTDYSAFLALNGHLGAGSLIGKIPAYIPNLANRPVYAVTTDRDNLFPSATMQEAIFAAKRDGADILYRQHGGGHDMDYWPVEAPLVTRFLERHPRDPLPNRIIWEASDPRFFRCDWFAIASIAEDRRAAWHMNARPQLTQSHASLGVVPDLSYTDGGVPVREVLKGSPSWQAGIRPGDILIRSGETRFADAGALAEFQQGLSRGGDVPITYRHEGTERTVTVRVPAPRSYDLLYRDKPSAMARVTFSANRFEVEGSRLGAFRLFIHPNMVNLDQPVLVRVGGKTVYNARVEPDLGFLLRNYLEERDRRALYVTELLIKP